MADDKPFVEEDHASRQAQENTENSEQEQATLAEQPVVKTAPNGTSSPAGFALTPEQRSKIKQQLLERQRAAQQESKPKERNPTATSSSTSGNHPSPSSVAKTNVSSHIQTNQAPRQDMIAQAVSFLQSPNVRSSPQERKVAFLKQKGLTEEEIQLATSRAGTSQPQPVSNISQPALPTNAFPPSSGYVPSPATSVPTSGQGLPTNRPFQVQSIPTTSRKEMWKNVLLALILSGGALSALVAFIRHYHIPSMMRFKVLYDSYLQKQRAMVADFVQKVASLGHMFAHQPEASQPIGQQVKTISSVFRASFESTDASLLRVTKELDLLNRRGHSQVEDSEGKGQENGPLALRDLRQSVDELSHLVSQETYFNPSMYALYSTFSKPDAFAAKGSDATAEWGKKVSEVKSEIRTLKGMLLSRRNFPTAQ
ncbi:uncharacterized protein SPPG_07442 [Spizellomyces punctatus DAOM BR117]|uniref:Peroxisomal membrane protein PEX14 n=1 Tax=Spizellomyces punctatus (strain DAOM BR117) TaxID=645134 RepID=A0A0L0H7V9_SPIPD|nr:uncharacterized protein SPPG_07442 [Spizellomyces punctatus DAOM BR117]KNC97044.1 hypothetical protein SPPG_07442 [Spizellomyces punctatus DAOM BR117]|eukprot:XP_016605084.1 hypothetical protein SPPG_07442 [Spizellomyces punctatus DAOM BR117]